MIKYLLPANGNFYKANLHTHTTVSDGSLTPEEVKKLYKEKGYSVVAFTDHETLKPHNELTDREFLALTAYEIATNEWRSSEFTEEKTYHLNLYAENKDRDVSSVWDAKRFWPPHAIEYVSEAQKQVNYRRTYSVQSINDVIARANAEGFLVCYNHPVWSTQNYADYAELEGLWGVEVYNTGCVHSGYPDTPQPLDDLLRQDKRVFPIAADDMHMPKDAFGGFVMLKAEKLEYGAVFSALKKGDFYASSGPELYELYVENGVVHIKCSPVREIAYSTNVRYTGMEKRGGELFTEAAFDLKPFSECAKKLSGRTPPYVRFTLTDASGERAYTRAYFLEELFE